MKEICCQHLGGHPGPVVGSWPLLVTWTRGQFWGTSQGEPLVAHLASRAAGDESAKGKYCIDLRKKKKVRAFCLEFRTQPREAQRETRERETRDCCLSTQHKLVDLLSIYIFLSFFGFFSPPQRGGYKLERPPSPLKFPQKLQDCSQHGSPKHSFRVAPSLSPGRQG